MSDELLELAERVSRGRRTNVHLEVEVEVALFEPDNLHTAIRANDAKTKVIYTDTAGVEYTAWPRDWTMPDRRSDTAKMLRARASRLRMEVE